MSDAQLFAYGFSATFVALAGAYTYFMGRFCETDIYDQDPIVEPSVMPTATTEKHS